MVPFPLQVGHDLQSTTLKQLSQRVYAVLVGTVPQVQRCATAFSPLQVGQVATPASFL